jgi:hypothetical protein
MSGKPRDLNKERFWRRILRQWQRSGLSIPDFCQQHRLSQHNFYAWRRTLAQRDAADVHFVPVQLLPEPTPLPTPDPPTAALELLLPDGRRLRIAPGFDAPTLRRLLALLQEGLP